MIVSKELKKKKDAEVKQIWIGVKPDAKLCKKCIHAYPDTEFTIGAEKANCEMFQPPDDKPMDILWENADCEFYEEK